MDDKIITSIYNSSLQKRPKKLQNNVFKLYIYQRESNYNQDSFLTTLNDGAKELKVKYTKI